MPRHPSWTTEHKTGVFTTEEYSALRTQIIKSASLGYVNVDYWYQERKIEVTRYSFNKLVRELNLAPVSDTRYKAIHLYHLGYNLNEIAKILSKTKDVIKGHLHKSRKLLLQVRGVLPAPDPKNKKNES